MGFAVRGGGMAHNVTDMSATNYIFFTPSFISLYLKHELFEPSLKGNKCLLKMYFIKTFKLIGIIKVFSFHKSIHQS